MADMAITWRDAEQADLPTIVAMLADDDLGATREAAGDGGALDAVPAAYLQAFQAIAADPNNRLLVACRGAEILGTFQLTYIPGLSFMGGTRAQIEAVRVHRRARGQGIGGQMIAWAIEEARRHGCRMVQLTSNKMRVDAIRFYEGLGFQATHEGFKLYL